MGLLPVPVSHCGPLKRAFLLRRRTISLLLQKERLSLLQPPFFFFTQIPNQLWATLGQIGRGTDTVAGAAAVWLELRLWRRHGNSRSLLFGSGQSDWHFGSEEPRHFSFFSSLQTLLFCPASEAFTAGRLIHWVRAEVSVRMTNHGSGRV